MSRLLSSLRSLPAQPSRTFGRSAARRLNSTNSTQQKAQEAAQKTQETAQKAQEKAQEALVAAQKGLAKAVELAKKASGGVGERAGSLLGSYREPLVYNLQVGRELLKQIYRTEQMQPPSFSTVTSVYQSLWQRARSPAYWRGVLQSGEYKTIGVYALEAYGIFKIGEILGRRHLVGYKLD